MFTTGHLIRIVKETENSGTSFTGKSTQWIVTLGLSRINSDSWLNSDSDLV